MIRLTLEVILHGVRHDLLLPDTISPTVSDYKIKNHLFLLRGLFWCDAVMTTKTKHKMLAFVRLYNSVATALIITVSVLIQVKFYPAMILIYIHVMEPNCFSV